MGLMFSTEFIADVLNRIEDELYEQAENMPVDWNVSGNPMAERLRGKQDLIKVIRAHLKAPRKA